MDTKAQHKTTRFEVLDSWRGICACIVVFYHMCFVANNHLASIPVVAYAYVFVDFFFVLSGFVIAASYQQKLLAGFPLRDYVMLRFGRIYPLHAFMLVLFMLFECTKYFVETKTQPFGDGGIVMMIPSFLMIHAFGFEGVLTNGPSWSISFEFFTYILFALALLVFSKNILWVCAAAVAASPLVLFMSAEQTIDITHGLLGFMRCIYGFAAGVLCYRLYSYIRDRRLSTLWSSVLEIAAVCAIFLFVAFCANNRISFFAPFVFSAALLVFTLESGFISKILKMRFFLFLGMLSYSIYMTHSFIQIFFVNVAKILAMKLGMHVFGYGEFHDYKGDMLGATAWQGDIWQIVCIVTVLCASYVTYRLVENPCNRWVRRRIQQKDHLNPPEGSSAAF